MASNPTVLYIEDDPVNMALVRKLLKVEGFSMLEATNGVSGIELARRYKPSLILMDMNMPDVDGYEATTQIKNSPDTAQIPVVAVTANAMPGDRERSLSVGCDGHITKPININTFADEVRSFIRSGAA